MTSGDELSSTQMICNEDELNLRLTEFTNCILSDEQHLGTPPIQQVKNIISLVDKLDSCSNSSIKRKPMLYKWHNVDPVASQSARADSNSNSNGMLPNSTDPVKCKRKRATPEQVEILQASFRKNPFPCTTERSRLAEELSMTPRAVQIWFQNRRQNIKSWQAAPRFIDPSQ